MHFLTSIPLLFALTTLVLAGHNCKCQDNTNQYNDKTQICCTSQAAPGAVILDIAEQAVAIAGDPENIMGDLIGVGKIFYDLVEEWSVQYHGDQHHQCSSWDNHIDSGAFVECCSELGVGDGSAFCWN